ncbi:MAG: hypothetical protein HY785_22215 [Oscillatoriophycideae cyanobacterium NC_groundwater_1537_Pr4_S-0.65um_50_18]|nr:hypothetical protein [Oscillatoriophycideae cyanobacterium NC_groundwater_1537_Pr4_S-0.65um_50_18]
MKRQIFIIQPELQIKLEKAAAQKYLSQSDIIRAALIQYFLDNDIN